jgi:hypothetical protein
MGDALSYGLMLAEEVSRADAEILKSALERFGERPSSPLGRIARLVLSLVFSGARFFLWCLSLVPG